MIDAMRNNLGIVTTSCKDVGIDRTTHYNWMKLDADYKAAIEDIADMALDFAESALHTQIRRGEVTSTIFYLKTKGKKRGYIEKTEVENSGSLTINWNETLTDEVEHKAE